MDILADPCFHAASLLWQPRPRAWVLTVVCKVTFDLLPLESRLAREQDTLNEADDHWDDDERRSLHAASDMVPFKRNADILLVGHAYAPQMDAVMSLVARLVVGEVDKTIHVHADRAWTPDGQLREGAPFIKMPLRWERAAGGPDTANPVGVRSGAQPDGHGQTAVPNLLPGFDLARPYDPIPPVGFGPIAPSWPGRRALLHRHAMSWDHRAWFERPLPGDIDAAFFNAAPPDQQVADIRCDERILLENLHPEHERLVTRLPGLAPRAMVERPGDEARELKMRCDTLCIDTDRGVCGLVWRGQVVLWSPDERGRVEISADAPRRSHVAATVLGGVAGPALPFRGRSEAHDPPSHEDMAETTRPPPAEDAGGTLMLIPNRDKPTLPFREGWAPRPMMSLRSTARPTPSTEEDGTGTIFGGLTPIGPALPFARRERAEHSPTVGASPSMPALLPCPEPLSALEPALPVEAVHHPPPAAAPREVLPPGAGPRRENEPGSAPPEEPEPVELPIEQFAAISAEIAEGRAARAEVLRLHDLTERAWTANELRWAKAMEEEAADGSSRLQAASDRAYVQTVEGFRGPITLSEYARILIGLERRRAVHVLDELEIQRPALMRIVRLWTKTVAGDARLAQEAQALLSAMRSP